MRLILSHDHDSCHLIREIFAKMAEEPYEMKLQSSAFIQTALTEASFAALFSACPFESDLINNGDGAVINSGYADLVLTHDQNTYGYNTLYQTILHLIKDHKISLNGKKAAVYGQGAETKTIRAALHSTGIVSEVIRGDGIERKDSGGQFSLLIKTGDSENDSLDLSRFPALEAVIDLRTDALRSGLILEAGYRNITALSGLQILIQRVFYACEHMTGRKQDPALMETCEKEILLKKQNIVLIGMPTCGKSTFSKLLAKETGRKVIEMDEEAVKRLGMPITECFKTKGEAYFRALETEIAKDLCRQTGIVISCGGGVIKTPETMRYLSENGLVIWLKRDLSLLFPGKDRPLSSNTEDLKRLYEERMPLYEYYADTVVNNNGTMESTLQQLIKAAGNNSRIVPDSVTLTSAGTGMYLMRVPSSKSASERAIITAALAPGASLIKDAGSSDDIKTVTKAMEAYGARIEERGNDLIIHGLSDTESKTRLIDCGESAAALRFLIPLFALKNQTTVFQGHGRLMERPLSVYEKIFRDQSLRFEKQDGRLIVQGPLHSGEFTVEGNISSQFISGLLMALPLAEGDSVLYVKEPFESSRYVDLTLAALKRAGIVIHKEGNSFSVPGNQTYRPFAYEVPGDDSQAAYGAVLACLGHSAIEVPNMSHDPIQADHILIEIMKDFGARVSETKTGYRFEYSSLKAAQTDLSQCPDLGPALFVLAANAEGTSVFTGCKRLRYKESDRIAAMEEELKKLGVDIRTEGDTVRIKGQPQIEGGIALYGHHDHRIVMALSVLAVTARKPLRISGAGAVRKSWPDFFEALEKAGMRIIPGLQETEIL